MSGEPTPWVTRWVKADGIRTRYIEAGDGPPVVLLHGGGPGSSGRWGWFRQLPALAPHFRAIALDQLGFGETERPAGLDYSDQDRVEHLAAFIDALCLAPLFLVGNSQGGYVAVRYALDHFERVHKVFLIGSGTIAQAMGLEHRPPRFEYDGTMESLRTGLQSTLLKPVSQEMLEGRYAMVQLPGAREVAQTALAYNRRIRAGDPDALQRFMLTERLPKSTVPIRMVWGKQDQFAPPALADQLRKLLPNIPIDIIDDAGHQVQHDQPEEVNRRIIEFFCSEQGKAA